MKMDSRRGVDWEKVPFVPRPSLIPDPITAFGKRQPRHQGRVSILEAINREGIEPDPRILARPIDDYRSPRDLNRERIANELHRREHNRATGHTTDADSIDTLLRRVHVLSRADTSRYTKPKSISNYRTKQTENKPKTNQKQTRTRISQTPRYTTIETSTPRESYTYSKTYKTVSESSNSSDPYSRPSTSSSSYSSTTERNSRGGPGGYSYSTERTSTTGSGPGGYSYSSTTSGRLPHGTTYRHYSYRV
ncbi:uncharacterized protein LOC118459701 [Anopheles albimanus]|nr:uncharacterized protein LOC118459701 [Anopheles albimanus]